MSVVDSIDPLVCETEVWKDVPGFSGYQVSNLGRLRSCRSKSGRGGFQPCWRLVKGNKNTRGYWRAVLCDGKSQIAVRIHRLVLEVFCPPAEAGMLACHNDGNKDNNRLDNLRWDTIRGNALDRIKHGTQQMGESHNSRKFTEEEVRYIRSAARSGILARVLAKRFDVCVTSIDRLLQRKTWKHLPTLEQETYLAFVPARLLEAKEASGLSGSRLGLLAGIDNGYICRLIQGRKTPSWKTICKLASALGVEPSFLCEHRPLVEIENTKGSRCKYR